jgi:hypothetical protein
MKKILIVMVFLLLLQQVSAQEKTEQSATDLAKNTELGCRPSQYVV